MLKKSFGGLGESAYVHDGSMHKVPSVAPEQDQSTAERAPHSSKHVMEGLGYVTHDDQQFGHQSFMLSARVYSACWHLQF